MKMIVTIASAAIVLYGTTTHGVWSPSHPELYPAPAPAFQQIPNVLPSIPTVETEERYVPETPLTDAEGRPLIQ